MTKTAVTPTAVPPPRLTGARVGWLVAGLLVAVFLIGWAGWGLHALTHSAKDVTIERTVTGTVNSLINDGSAGCVTPSGGGKQVCGIFYLDPQHPLHQGQAVHIVVERARLGHQSFELLVVYSPAGSQ